MGAATLQLRKLDYNPLRLTCQAGFNGAATLQLRKLPAATPWAGQLRDRFNGAATLQLRKLWGNQSERRR